MADLPLADLERAAEALSRAEALLVGAGAGMGVDSGLPDFRGDEGFWNAYPPFRHLGLSFIDLANPQWFERDPAVAWGFYGHRLNLYRETVPHPGYSLLREWGQPLPHGGFVFTSNVDGQFQKAGFTEAQTVECHGSILHLQSLDGAEGRVWPVADTPIDVDEETMRAQEPLPRDESSGKLARPNILMFGDWHWLERRTQLQEKELRNWLGQVDPERLVIVECGAGTTIPSVRYLSEKHVARGASLIRINPRESQHPEGEIGLATGALAGLQAIDALLRPT